MTLNPTTIKPTRGSAKKNVKRVGRGNASGRGTFSGRGCKGQRARSGGKRGLQQRAFKSQLQKIPKVRGFRSFAVKPETITLSALNRVAEEGVEVTPWFLAEHGAIRSGSNGAKIVATGELTKKLTIKNCLATKQALSAIEKAGGTFEI
ncbi:MAG: 50S ribosomal protein L15 [Candidatus Magasanikbacteria bacterium]